MANEKTKQCSICGAEIATNAKVCPQCGGKNKKPVYKRGWFIALIIIVLLLGIGMSGDDETEDVQKPTSDTQQTEVQGGEAAQGNDSETKKDNIIDGFEIMGDFTYEHDGFSYYIKGKVKNCKGRDLSYAQISFNLYDKDGAQIGTAFDNISGLKEDGVWKFEAMVLEDDTDKWEFDSIESW